MHRVGAIFRRLDSNSNIGISMIVIQATCVHDTLHDAVFCTLLTCLCALQTAAGSTNIRVGSTIFGKRDYTGSKPSDPNQQETEQAEKSLQS